jgi:TPR repeat protein
MRIRHLIIAALFIGATSLHAGQVISQDTLDQTLLNAQNAIQEQNYSEAFALYSQAAQWGHKGAQYVLGELYLQGKGVARDPVAGYAWLQVAAEAPDREFIKARNAAGKKLSDSEKQEADVLAEKIAAAYGVEASGVICKKEGRVGTHIKSVNCYHRRTAAGGGLIVPDYHEDLQPAS